MFLSSIGREDVTTLIYRVATIVTFYNFLHSLNILNLFERVHRFCSKFTRNLRCEGPIYFSLIHRTNVENVIPVAVGYTLSVVVRYLVCNGVVVSISVIVMFFIITSYSLSSYKLSIYHHLLSDVGHSWKDYILLS